MDIASPMRRVNLLKKYPGLVLLEQILGVDAYLLI